MLPSGNDAALALAKWGGIVLLEKGEESTLPVENNAKLNRFNVFMGFLNDYCLVTLGMKSSYFGNPHGLPHVKSGTTV